MADKPGRPTDFTPDIADEICERIADGESLRSICAENEMPNKATVFRWLARHADFSDQYARARDEQAETLFDEILDIADDGSNDWMEKHGTEGEVIGWRENGEALRRSQLRVDARKWMAGKLKPKKFGDKIDLNHSGSIQQLSEDALDARLAVLLGKTGTSTSAGGEGEA